MQQGGEFGRQIGSAEESFHVVGIAFTQIEFRIVKDIRERESGKGFRGAAVVYQHSVSVDAGDFQVPKIEIIMIVIDRYSIRIAFFQFYGFQADGEVSFFTQWLKKQVASGETVRVVGFVNDTPF